MMKAFKHIFGPVPSRRLGFSLGIDLVPYKVCTMNCVYCEIGRTNNLTVKRSEYIEYDEIISEIEIYMKNSPKLDFITFSGAGEPTLNNKIGDVVRFIKRNYPQFKLALLTNGSLLTSKFVRDECSPFDVILPSLDAVSEIKFKKINRPHSSLNNRKIIDGLIALREEYDKQIWLEIFIVPGINDDQDELTLLCDKISGIKPDRIQLNSLDRPGVEKWVNHLSKEKLNNIVTQLSKFDVEVIGANESSFGKETKSGNLSEIIKATIKRRPSTINDLYKITGISISDLNRELKGLTMQKIIEGEYRKRGLFYKLINHN